LLERIRYQIEAAGLSELVRVKSISDSACFVKVLNQDQFLLAFLPRFSHKLIFDNTKDSIVSIAEPFLGITVVECKVWKLFM
jgi:hypothetical protein